MPPGHRSSRFAHVNGIRLHYLDWGGPGPALVFLAGMGSSAYIFSNFAPRFADQFRVLALTRRGHGDSDYPVNGYDADTLTEDIRQFLDLLQIKRASLAGHSLAGVELTHFAATHPGRVSRLVYLDALDDRRRIPELRTRNPLRNVQVNAEPRAPRTFEEYVAGIKRDVPDFAEIWSELWDEELAHGVRLNEHGVYVDRMPEHVTQMLTENLIDGYAPRPIQARIPILAFFAFGKPKLSSAYTAEQAALFDEFNREIRLPFGRSLVSDFRQRFPHAEIVVMPEGHHYCFIAQQEQVYERMRSFLLEKP
jgi:pimeloyl-ACP methyl ester carboxylesterase